MVEQFQKTKQLPEGAEQYFGVDAKKAFASATKKVKKPRMTGDENLDYDWKETPEGWVKVPGSEGAFYRFGEKNKDFIDKGVSKMVGGVDERTLIKTKYPGITDDLLDKILVDTNPQRKAEVMATMDEYLKLREIGKSEAEASDIISKFIKKTPTKHAYGGIAGELHLNRQGYDKGKLVKVYRGQSVPINPLKKRSSSLYNKFGRTRVGRYATTSAAEAANYATRNFPNVIKTTKITPGELRVGKRVYHELEPHFTEEGVKTKRVRKILKDVTGNLDRNYNILSKKNKAKLKVDILKTIASNAKALTPLAAKGLNFLASLPVATLAMVFHSTPANPDEVNMKLEDFANLAEKQNMATGGIAGELHLNQGGRVSFTKGGKVSSGLAHVLGV
jgi:hypothetical protein